jgi:hypothetical protein
MRVHRNVGHEDAQADEEYSVGVHHRQLGGADSEPSACRGLPEGLSIAPRTASESRPRSQTAGALSVEPEYAELEVLHTMRELHEDHPDRA